MTSMSKNSQRVKVIVFPPYSPGRPKVVVDARVHIFAATAIEGVGG